MALAASPARTCRKRRLRVSMTEYVKLTFAEVHEHHHSDAGKKGAESQHAAQAEGRVTHSEGAVRPLRRCFHR